MLLAPVEETTRVELFCKSTGHVRVAPTSQKLLAAQLEEDMDGAEVVDGFGWALLKQDLWF